jgi:hypothetical protein
MGTSLSFARVFDACNHAKSTRNPVLFASSKSIRKSAKVQVRVLGRLGRGDKRVHVVLANLLKSGREHLREAAAEAIGGCLESEGTRLLLDVAETQLRCESSDDVARLLKESIVLLRAF